MRKGILISFEGMDGLGKTTQAQALGEMIREHMHKDVVITREPGGTEVGRKLREILLHSSEPVDRTTELLLMIADRAQHVAEVIRPALDRGAIVITDRYFDSTLAYQGYGRGWDASTLWELHHIAAGSLLPDLTFVFEGTPFRTSGDDRFERLQSDFQRRVSEGFTSLLSTARQYIRVNANQDADRITSELYEHLCQFIEQD